MSFREGLLSEKKVSYKIFDLSKIVIFILNYFYPFVYFQLTLSGITGGLLISFVMEDVGCSPNLPKLRRILPRVEESPGTPV